MYTYLNANDSNTFPFHTHAHMGAHSRDIANIWLRIVDRPTHTFVHAQPARLRVRPLYMRRRVQSNTHRYTCGLNAARKGQCDKPRAIIIQ